MIQIVVQSEVADKIRHSEGPVELVDDHGNRIGLVRRFPTEEEIQFAKSRIGISGPKFTFDELISKVEKL